MAIRGASLARQADARAHAAARRSRPWLEWLGRAGYAANGVVYGLVGLLAAQAAIGAGGATTDTHGALAPILEAPEGRLLLGLVAVGLAGYAVWRFLQAVLDAEGKGTQPTAIVERVGFAISGVIYLGLALSAADLVRGTGGGTSGDQATQDRTAWLLGQPFGPWLVAAAGLVVIGIGLAQFYRAYRASFRDKLRRDLMSASTAIWAMRLGRLGFAARGVVFVLTGIFLLVAAWQADPQQARGLGGVLATLAGQPSGPWLLGLVAAGLVAYGGFLLVEARYRRMVIN